MRLFIGDATFEWFKYDGAVGLFFDGVTYGIICYILSVLFAFLAVVGLITMVKWLFTRKRKIKK